jgi:hypothetical protein
MPQKDTKSSLKLQESLQKAKSKLQLQQSICLKIKVTAKSGKHEFSDLMADGTIKIKLKAVRDKGKANAELIELLSDFFGVSRKNINILTGEKAAQKIIEINP